MWIAVVVVEGENPPPTGLWSLWVSGRCGALPHTQHLSPSLAALSGFRVDMLSKEHVHKAHAWNAQKQLVYLFECNWPGYCYNAIYDDMPLRGWWPWPTLAEGSTRLCGRFRPGGGIG